MQGKVLRDCNGAFMNSNTWYYDPNSNIQCLYVLKRKHFDYKAD